MKHADLFTGLRRVNIVVLFGIEFILKNLHYYILMFVEFAMLVFPNK